VEEFQERPLAVLKLFRDQVGLQLVCDRYPPPRGAQPPLSDPLPAPDSRGGFCLLSARRRGPSSDDRHHDRAGARGVGIRRDHTNASATAP
jgi:hypothetical protein